MASDAFFLFFFFLLKSLTWLVNLKLDLCLKIDPDRIIGEHRLVHRTAAGKPHDFFATVSDIAPMRYRVARGRLASLGESDRCYGPVLDTGAERVFHLRNALLVAELGFVLANCARYVPWRL